jgi:amidase
VTSLVGRSAGELAALVRDREVSSEEVVRAHLDRIEAANPQINAVIAVAADRALAEGRAADRALARGDDAGPLHGVPFTIKDSIDTEGVVTTWGTAGRRDHVPSADATVVARLRRAGGILIGKTNVPELAMSYDTDNALHGPTRNPYDLTRSPGGSSGGAAAAVAACLSPLDIGTDTAGSIRIPAHFCGIAGLKASAGRVPRTGQSGWRASHLESLTQVGPLARTVADLALALTLIAGPDGADPALAPVRLERPEEVALEGLRVGVFAGNGIDTADGATVDALDGAGRALTGRGALVAPATPPGLDRLPDVVSRIIVGDGGWWMARLLEEVGTGASTFGTFPLRPPMSAEDYVLLLEDRERLRAELLSFMAGYDLLLCPVTAGPALPLGVAGTAARPPGFTFTHPFNLTGWPVAVVRCGTSPEGLPIGLQIVARPWRDDVALAAAAALEATLGGWRPPPLPA